jgi:hypothetical protein
VDLPCPKALDKINRVNSVNTACFSKAGVDARTMAISLVSEIKNGTDLNSFNRS